MFYGLPVVQLMVTYQEMSNSTGNQGCTQLKANFGRKLSHYVYVLISRFIFFNQTQIQDPVKLDL